MSADNQRSKLEQIPNSVSGDGKSFVAQLKKYLQAFRDNTQDKIDSIGAGAVEQVFGLRLTEEHDYDSKGNPINNIFVEFDNTNVSNYLNAQIWMKKSTENAYRLVGTTSNVTYTIPDVLTGATYYVKVVACNTNSGTSDFDDAPEEDITITGTVLVPAAPTQFYLTFDEEGAKWEWQFVDNGYIDFFELRMDGHAGTWDSNRLDSTRNNYSRVAPPARSGTAYLFIRNIYGMYSLPATHTFNIAAPAKPTAPTLEMTLDGVVITMDALPLGCISYELEITDYENNVEIFESKNNQFVYFQFSGTISVRYRFVDPAGHGEWSNATSGNVKTVLNAIELPAISYNQFDAATKAAVDRATTALAAVDDLGDQLLEIITAQGEDTSSQFALLQSQVNTNTGSINTVIANLGVSPDGTNSYTAINQLKQTADTLSSTISSNQTTQNGINQTVSTNISNLQQTASGLSSTVQTLTGTTIPGLAAADTALSNRITTNATNITQTASNITAVVTELSKTNPSQVNYAAISALASGIDLCVKDTDLTGAEIVNRINIQPQVTTIDGKFLHVTGNTVFDNGVIVGGNLANNTITGGKIYAGNDDSSRIGATSIKNGAITTDKIAANAVTAAKITSNTITSDKLYTGSTEANKIKAAHIYAGSTESDRIQSNNIAAGSIITDKIAANAVTAAKMSVTQLSAITANMGTLTSGKIQNQNGTFVVDAAGTVTGATIIGSIIRNAANTFSVSKDGVVTGATIIASTIQNAATNPSFKVSSTGTITGAKIIAPQIQNAESNPSFSVDASGNINGATLTAATINSGTINANIIYAAGYKITASKLRTGNVYTKDGVTEIPLPDGYNEDECFWGITTVSGQPPLTLVGRKVYYSYDLAKGITYTTNSSEKYYSRYWILGIKGVDKQT